MASVDLKAKVLKWLVKNKLLVGILVLGLILRLYNITEIFYYGHDQDLASWIVKDVVVNNHFRLIGQQTSTLGIFIGPLWYYSLIPFYLLFQMDPIAIAYQSTFVGLFAIGSCYFIFKTIFNKNVGLITSLLYAVSIFTVNNDREGVPTTPVLLWTFWGVYVMQLLLKGKDGKVFILAGILAGLIWHFNFALIFFLPVWLLAYLMGKKYYQVRDYFAGIGAFVLTSLPLILFEVRHGFIQVKAMFNSLSADQGDTVYLGIEKFERVLFLISKNFNGLLSANTFWLGNSLMLVMLLITFLYLVRRKVLDKKLAKLFLALFVIFVLFFSNYSKIVSEYYLNGITFLPLIGMALFINEIVKKNKRFGFAVLLFVLILNLFAYTKFAPEKNGYKYRKEVVGEIKSDMVANNYPCVGISYLTDPGYDLGYRYFMWLDDMHIVKITNEVPVYSIVFPLRDYFVIDNRFGSVGLIKPDAINPATITCGENINETVPLFGYTE